MKGILILPVLLILFPGSGQAASIQSGQESIDITLLPGESWEYYLILNAEGGDIMTASGEASSWIRLGASDQEQVTFPASGTQYLRINISVPKGQAIGTYSTEILSNGNTLSSLRIIVTLPNEEIEALRALADVNSKISSLEENLKDEVGTIKSELSDSIQKVRDYQEALESLGEEKHSLEKRVENLTSEVNRMENRTTTLEEEKQSLEITGNLIRTEGQMLFVIGILIGAGGIYLFYRKLHRYL